MDLLYFLKERTRLIRQYYEQAARPFSETNLKDRGGRRAIRSTLQRGSGAGNSDPVDRSQRTARSDGAELRVDAVRITAALPERLVPNPGLQCKAQFKTDFKRDGLIGGYRQCLATRLVLDWKDCPADLAITEQVVLARNGDQHPDSITTLRVTHTDQDRARHPRPFFLNDKDAELYDNGDGAGLWMSPREGLHNATRSDD